MEIERMNAPREESTPKDATLSDAKAFSSALTLTQGMLNTTEKNQEAIQKLLDATKQATENQEAVDKALSQKIEAQIQAQKNAFDLRMKAIDEATKALTHCASNGARIGVNDAILSVKEQALAAFKQGVSPDLSELKRVTQGIDDAREKLKTASQYLTWKAVGIYAVVALVPLLALFAWEKHLVEKIETEQVTINNLNENGGKAQLSHCGDDHRLCVLIDQKVGHFGTNGDYLVIKGY
jgi:hypothetical protein